MAQGTLDTLSEPHANLSEPHANLTETQERETEIQECSQQDRLFILDY